ncbi:peroxisome biogenesis protein 12-like [Dorcoceras hygrometricum]|uniref:Peroxisome biogenesis protein 12-like n=1 Tax=Dorcoceras hygrometricum TaxID=472368 RepID=A0A2Z7AS61_9LAMI|nr:peroxisome biogenesis protein 12-like [Dorcoceras hygrometricum]
MAESQNLKADQEQIQQNNSGHGVCEYMGATHSSQHTAPDAKHSSTCCCPTHEVWELSPPLIVANRSSREMWVMGVTRSTSNELLRLDEQSRAMVNAGQRSCACDWLCWYVASGTRRGKRCALFCVLHLDDQQLVLRIEHPMRRRLDKLVRRCFEDQSMLREIVRYCSLQLVVITVVSDWICLAWLEISSAGLQFRYQILYLEYFQPFVPYLSNPRALFSREFSGEFPEFPVVVLLV